MGKPTVRTMQLIAPFGVGSLCEVDGQSFFVRGTGSWEGDDNLKQINLPALTDRLRPGTRLNTPTRSVAVARFPRWHFCPSCRQMEFWSHGRDDRGADSADPLPIPSCSRIQCRSQRLVPMRFVAVCDAGHLSEVDWYHWAHRHRQIAEHGQCSRRASSLSFVVTGQSGGDFSSMRIRCSCGAESSLEGISDGPLPQTCTGHQPGETAVGCLRPGDTEGRPRQMFLEPRGSSALHYASIISALDISRPAGTGILQQLEGDPVFLPLLQVMRGQDAAALAVFRGAMNAIAERLGLDTAAAWNAILAELARREADAGPAGAVEDDSLSQSDILDEEFPILASEAPIDERWLKTRPMPPSSRHGLDRLLAKIVKVERLREVRAFRGFKRRNPGSDNPTISPSLNRPAPIWLPAIQVLGEGIFVEFREAEVRRWLDDQADAVREYTERQLQAASEAGLPERMGFQCNPVFVLAHTFAHLLINQLSFDCGYSSTSLRERIYCGTLENPYAGVLVYTADSDSEGSMGGLVELGDPQRFADVAYRAVSRSAWCSGDPVCRELESQGINGLNRAACHACSLVAETSCTCSNVLLDRVLVSGSGRPNGRGVREPVGYFRCMMEP